MPVETNKTPRILIIKPSSLGDVVHGLPVLAALRKAHPRAHVAWLIGRSFAPLLENHPLIDELIIFDRQRLGRLWRSPAALAEFARFVGRLRGAHFDLVVDLQGLVRSGFFAWISGARQRIGFAAARELGWAFYNQRVACPPGEHAVERNLRVARALHWEAERPSFPLAITDAERDHARRRLHEAGIADAPFIAVLPGARWESKCWPELSFADLLNHLSRAGLPACVLLGAPDERPRVQRILAASRATPVDLCGRTTLREMVAIIEEAALVICQDSGPMHVAAALNRPMIALFGPTDPRRTGPYSGAARVLSHAVPCQPCFRRRCPLKHHDCLARLEVQRVVEAARDVLSAPRKAADSDRNEPAVQMGAAGFEPA